MALTIGLARDKKPPFAGVRRSVEEPTGKTIRWEQDQAARAQSLQMVRRDLEKAAHR